MLSLPATLRADEASAAMSVLGIALSEEPGDQIVVDASALTNFDSAALAVLIECRRQAQTAGKKCTLQNASSQLLALAELYGVDGLLPASA
jgi:phospholipid transport system transporter-binding protein